MEYQVALVESAPETVLRMPRELRPDPSLLGEDIAEGMREVSRMVRYAGLTASGAPTITFRHDVPEGESVAVEFGVPVEPAPNLGPGSGAQVVVLPGALVARTCHRGSYRDLGAAYQALREWMRDGGYRPIGPPTEAYLIGPDEVTDPRLLLTEIRLPVAPAATVAIHLDAPFEDAVHRTREALRCAGLTVIAEVDLQSTLRERIGEQIEDYSMLVVCDPELTYRALLTDRHAGATFSCGVVVRSAGAGTLVEAADPELLVCVTAQPGLRSLAGDMRRRLAAALGGLRDSAPAPT
ncbi:DUF302 domain-containing protein [Nocardia beijingensis]|uniref:DUF302 domain-containing protein n=1 Tax=Nocardia beijingensis TaxID=95162 RepID=UPI001893C040|nr:GyrI-like domain-containing protein [Nocardia beijingensis]MBF6469725.1 DUF302 domain-containing protein [Nocardia beijingensis]